MSHHGNDHERERAMSEAMQKIFGEHPDGKLNANDEGGIVMAVAVESGRVVLHFPKPVKWIGMTADEAVGLAESLIERAREAGSTKPLTVRIGRT